MAAVEFVDVDVADEVEVAVHQRGVRLHFVDGVVHVEHGADGGAGDFVARWRRLRRASAPRRTAPSGSASTSTVTPRASACGATDGQAIDVIARGLLAGESAGGRALIGRAEDHDAVRAEIGAEIDQVADVVPASAAQRRVGRGDVQALWD